MRGCGKEVFTSLALVLCLGHRIQSRIFSNRMDVWYNIKVCVEISVIHVTFITGVLASNACVLFYIEYIATARIVNL